MIVGLFGMFFDIFYWRVFCCLWFDDYRWFVIVLIIVGLIWDIVVRFGYYCYRNRRFVIESDYDWMYLVSLVLCLLFKGG